MADEPMSDKQYVVTSIKSVRIQTAYGEGRAIDRSGRPTFYKTLRDREVAACRCPDPACRGPRGNQLWTYYSLGQAIWGHWWWIHGGRPENRR